MLSTANRIRRGADFRSITRSGRRTTVTTMVVYQRSSDLTEPTRFGFIVGKTVGNSVVRHRVTRRLRAIAFAMLPSVPTGSDIVIRALPASADARWDTLQAEMTMSIRTASAR